MSLHRPLILTAAAAALALLGGCVHMPPPHDYTAFRQAKPATLLVMPPVSDALDLKASPGVWANATLPLAEAGYYVLPVTLVDATFRQNGVDNANDAQALPTQKLHEVFGADAAVYIKVSRYGTRYQVINSDTSVEVSARIVDLRTGALLWEGKAEASSSEQSQGQNGLAAMMIEALVRQVVGTATDLSFNYAAIADQRLLGAQGADGVLPGPRSPKYGQAPAAR